MNKFDKFVRNPFFLFPFSFDSNVEIAAQSETLGELFPAISVKAFRENCRQKVVQIYSEIKEKTIIKKNHLGKFRINKINFPFFFS